jgi:hypothetical protein
VGEDVVQEGDFLEITYTYEYTETVTEEVESVSFTTTTNTTPVTTTNLVPSAQVTDTNINVVGPQGNTYGMTGAEFTTGNQQQNGGRRVYSRAFNEENKQSVDYGLTVHSHGSNAQVPVCGNTTGDCRDDWSVTVRLFNDDVLVDTITHSYTGINWAGSREYSWTEDVSTLTFDYGEMELYGIDRGYYSGYYGPGFSDVFARLTYNAIEEVVNRIVSYTEMQSVSTTDVYVYDSIYNPTVEVIDVQLEPITETEFEIVVEVQDLSTEVVEVFEIEVETTSPVIETFESELEISEIETFETNIEEPVSDTVEVADIQPEESAPEEGQGQLQEETEASESESVDEVVDETNEDQEKVEAPQTSEPAEETEEQAESVEEVEKPKQRSRYSVALDSVKVALMVRNEATRGFATYRKETVPDVPFYVSVPLDGGEVVDNPLQRWFVGSSDVLMDEMVNSQWQK